MSAKQRVLDKSLRIADARWSFRNRRAARVFIYTDSRGTNMSTPLLAKVKHHLGSHVDRLQREYRINYAVCPHDHTTLIDFLSFANDRDLRQYDAIILHCGVVDFSPRPLSNIAKVRRAKAGDPRFDELFEANEALYANPQGAEYRGEPTTTLYSTEYHARVVKELAAIPNLGWISSNSFVPGWNGNWKPRPTDIDDVVRTFDTAMHAGLQHTLDLRQWSYDDVQRFTVDNIHFNGAGFADLTGRVSTLIQQIVAASSHGR